MTDEIHPLQLEIYRHLLTSVPEEMGSVLRRTAHSSNVKERRDYSCALFDGQGQLVAMGDHMPVHLGSMPMSVEAAVSSGPLQPGDVVILNDPFSGGTHLPDLTMVAPVYEPSDGFSKPIFYVAARAHHADVGGISPGSMPLSSDIFQEGIRVPPTRLYRGGQLNSDLLHLILSNVRTPLEREGDLAAQVGSLSVGNRRLRALTEKNGRVEVEQCCRALQDYSEKVMRQAISNIPDGCYQAEDLLDDGGCPGGHKEAIPIRVSIGISGESMKIDFQGSARQVLGCMNAVHSVTLSAVYYILRCLAPDYAPASAGLMRPVKVLTPEASIVNARFPSATAGGNVETSQRIVDVLLRALSEALPEQIPAASSGTMNTVSIGGFYPGTQDLFAYIETIGGGMGAGPWGDGESGIHTHMTNSLNTPIEALEYDFPIRVGEYRLRSGSGASGQFRGGDGIIRTLEALVDCTATILSERRVHSPYGLNGGRSGKKGRNQLVDQEGARKPIDGKVSVQLYRGQALSIETPGGGAWGRSRKSKKI